MLTIGTVLIPQLLILFVIYMAWVYFRVKGRGYFDLPATEDQQVRKPQAARRPPR